MPPTRVATAVQDQTRSERKTTRRAASVPVGRQGNSRLESLRLKRHSSSLLDVEHTPPPSLSSVVIGENGRHSVCNTPVARGRKRARDSSSCVTSQEDCVVLVAGQTANANDDQRPRKRCKRSSSTPAAPKPSHPSAQLQLRRCTRSRAGSPTTDGGRTLPSRVSARLARKIQPLINCRSSDIYTHLADPDGAGNLLSASPTGPVILSTPNEFVGFRSAKRPRGRQRKVDDLTDEDAKKELIEEWARMRQSQGALPLSGINGNASFSQVALHENRKSDRSVSAIQLGAIAQRRTPGADLVKSQTTAIINISQSQSQETLDVSLQASFSTRINSRNASPVGMDVPEKKLDQKDSVPLYDGRAEQPVSPSSGTSPPASIFESLTDGDTLVDKPGGVRGSAHHLGSLLCSAYSLSPLSTSPLQAESVLNGRTKPINMPVKEQISTTDLDNLLEHDHPVTFAQTHLLDTGRIHLDAEEEFYMLDIPEIFTLPWVPMSPHLYVPPGLGKLVSGMKEQLAMEARARRRAEELYQAELSRRISAEQTIGDLRIELKRQRNSSDKPNR